MLWGVFFLYVTTGAKSFIMKCNDIVYIASRLLQPHASLPRALEQVRFLWYIIIHILQRPLCS